jgi:lipopolysaccharide export system protein LptA
MQNIIIPLIFAVLFCLDARADVTSPVAGDQATVSDPAAQPNVVVQNNIKGSTTYDKNVIDFEAKKAMYHTDGSTLELKNDVKFKTSEGVALETDSLAWNKKDNLVTTPDEVKISKSNPDFNVTGKGLTASPGMKTVNLDNSVKVEIPKQQGAGAEAGFIVVTCDGPLEVQYDNGMAIFHDNVHVDQNESELYADMAYVYFDSKTRALTKVVAEGNVKVVRGKDVSYADKATYFADGKRVILEGRPRLVIFPEKGMDGADFAQSFSGTKKDSKKK